MSDEEDKVVNIFTKKPEPEITFGDIDPKLVLNAAIDANVRECLVIGWGEDGEFYIASSGGYTPDLVVMCEIAKATLIAGYEA